MTDAQFHSYRFNDENDPSDAQLAELMRQAAADARESNEKANKRFFETLHEKCEEAKNRSYLILRKYELNP